MNKLKKCLCVWGKSLRGLAEGFGVVIFMFLIFGSDNNGNNAAISVWNTSVAKNGVIITLAIIFLLVVSGYMMDETINKF